MLLKVGHTARWTVRLTQETVENRDRLITGNRGNSLTIIIEFVIFSRR